MSEDDEAKGIIGRAQTDEARRALAEELRRYSRRTPVDGEALVGALTSLMHSQIAIAEAVAKLAEDIANLHRQVPPRNLGEVGSRLSRFQIETRAATQALNSLANSIK